MTTIEPDETTLKSTKKRKNKIEEATSTAPMKHKRKIKKNKRIKKRKKNVSTYKSIYRMRSPKRKTSSASKKRPKNRFYVVGRKKKKKRNAGERYPHTETIIKKRKNTPKKRKKKRPDFCIDTTSRLPEYNPLKDRSLSRFFQIPHYRNQLVNNYLVDNSGRILDSSSNSQSIRIIQKEFDRLRKQQAVLERERREEKRKELSERKKRKEMRYRRLKVELQRRNLASRLLKNRSAYVTSTYGDVRRHSDTNDLGNDNAKTNKLSVRPSTSYVSKTRKSDPLILGKIEKEEEKKNDDIKMKEIEEVQFEDDFETE